jgi:hypothetical protein
MPWNFQKHEPPPGFTDCSYCSIREQCQLHKGVIGPSGCYSLKLWLMKETKTHWKKCKDCKHFQNDCLAGQANHAWSDVCDAPVHADSVLVM